MSIDPKNSEKQKRFYDKRTGQGVCPKCSQPIDDPEKYSYCKTCREKRAAAKRLRNANRKAEDICIDCGRKKHNMRRNPDGLTPLRCDECLDRNNGVSIELRQNAIRAYGSKCYCCGARDHLLVEHTEAKSFKARYQWGATFYAKLAEHNYPKGWFRTVCDECSVPTLDDSGGCSRHQSF